jgi:hypothetical protein
MKNVFRKLAPFTDDWLHNRVKEQLLGNSMGWNFPSYATEGQDLNNAAFGKCAFNKQQNIVNWHGVDSLTYVLDNWLDQNKDWFRISFLNHCMVNLYTAGQVTAWHNDNSQRIPGMYSLLYYVDDSDGGTEFEDQKLLHKENTGLFFDSNLQHKPIESTQPRRISVSWVLNGTVR